MSAENCDCWKAGPLCTSCREYEREFRKRARRSAKNLAEEIARDFDAMYPPAPSSNSAH